MLSEIFFTFMITSVIGLILKLSNDCFKSKCSSVKCCGIEVIRDVIIEEKEVEFKTLHKTSTSSDASV